MHYYVFTSEQQIGVVLQQHLQLRLFHGEIAVASDVKTERLEPTSQSLLSSLLRRASPISATIDPSCQLVGICRTHSSPSPFGQTYT